jgi:hypothetical protein
LLNKPVLLVNLQGLYPDRHTDVEVSSGDDDASKIDTLAVELRPPAGNEAQGEGIYSIESIAPGPIRSNMLAQADPSIANWVISRTPSTSGQNQKRPPPITKCKPSKSPVDHVMTQIEPPPYRGPRRPLDLVAIEINFGHLFEVFKHASQAADTKTLAGDDTQPPKRTRAPSLKTILAPRQVITHYLML